MNRLFDWKFFCFAAVIVLSVFSFSTSVFALPTNTAVEKNNVIDANLSEKNGRLASGNESVSDVNWYFLIENKPSEPFWEKKILKMIAEGQIKKDTKVNKAGTTNWVFAASAFPNAFVDAEAGVMEIPPPAPVPPSVSSEKNGSYGMSL